MAALDSKRLVAPETSPESNSLIAFLISFFCPKEREIDKIKK